MAQRIITAKPDSSITYNATLTCTEDATKTIAQVQYRQIKDKGQVIFFDPPITYDVQHELYSGQWDVVATKGDGKPLITATKPKWYSNTVVCVMEGVTYEMKRPTIRNRDYVVCRVEEGKEDGELRGPKVGEVTSNGAFKRSYTLSFEESVPVEMQVFCYWMVNLLNKRANTAHSSGGNAGAYC